MTAQERKEKTELYLKESGIPVNPGLPPIEEETEIVIRSAADIAKRIFILVYMGVYAEDGDRDEIMHFFKSEKLWDFISENEKELLLKKKLTEKDKIYISWRSEAIYLLLWSIHKIEELALPVEQCDIAGMLDLLPDAFESTKEFIESATVRTRREILDQSDLIYRLHWAVREADSNDDDIPADMDPGIIQEWHYAINWITFYDEDWDNITTDT
jgi:hypothetical protein